jgi:hypothetical protein
MLLAGTPDLYISLACLISCHLEVIVDLLLIILVLFLIFGGGGYWGYRRWR